MGYLFRNASSAIGTSNEAQVAAGDWPEQFKGIPDYEHHFGDDDATSLEQARALIRPVDLKFKPPRRGTYPCRAFLSHKIASVTGRLECQTSCLPRLPAHLAGLVYDL